MRCGTANSVAKALSVLVTSKLGRASSATLRRARGDAGAGAAMAMAGTGAALGVGGAMSSVHGRGRRPCVARPGWPVERVSCTLLQSSPLFWATRAWRSSSTLGLAASSVAR